MGRKKKEGRRKKGGRSGRGRAELWRINRSRGSDLGYGRIGLKGEGESRGMLRWSDEAVITTD